MKTIAEVYANLAILVISVIGLFGILLFMFLLYHGALHSKCCHHLL